MSAAAPPGVLILGGGGRVGASTVRALRRLLAEQPQAGVRAARLVLGGRRGRRAAARDGAEGEVGYVTVDARDAGALDRVVGAGGYQLVVNLAGPFQGAEPRPLAVCGRRGVAYVDVCDDLRYASVGQQLYERERFGSAAWVCTGIYPGVSNLMAALGVERLGEPVESVKFAYYTAGSGGVGATILASTFFLLGEDVVTFQRQKDGGNGDVRLVKKPGSEPEKIDFGGNIGRKEVYLLNLPEVASIHNSLLRKYGGSVEARFGTDPPLWNYLLRAIAAFVPKAVLRNKGLMQALARISIPVVRFVDRFSGEATGMRVDVLGRHGRRVTVSYEHESLKKCVGEATAAFVFELLRTDRSTPVGHFYPEQLDRETRGRILRNAIHSAARFSVDEQPAGGSKPAIRAMRGPRS